MKRSDTIQRFRRRLQGLEDEFVDLAMEAKTMKESKALDLVAMELHDLDRALYEAVFINNNSKISKLIAEITEVTRAGELIKHHLNELSDALKIARETIKDAESYTAAAKRLMSEVNEIIGLVTG